MEDMDDRKRKIEVIQQFEKLIDDEIARMEIPDKFKEIERTISDGKDREKLLEDINISGNEVPIFSSLCLNNELRLAEFERSFGALLLYSQAGSKSSSVIEETDYTLDNSYHFWMGYGDYWIKSCSLLDSIGTFLALVFFGLVDAPLYYNQIIDAIALKYVPGKRLVLDGEPYKLSDRESWKLLIGTKSDYQDFRSRRDEIIHVFSPQMYWRHKEDSFEYYIRRVLRHPSLDSTRALEACKQSFFKLRLVPLAANDLAASYVGTGSYHRNYRWIE